MGSRDKCAREGSGVRGTGVLAVSKQLETQTGLFDFRRLAVR